MSEKIEFHCYGHQNVFGTHHSTLEITKDKDLSPRGDCIVGINSDIALVDISEEIKKMIQDEKSIVKLILEVENLKEEIIGYGHKNLELSDKRAMIARKSSYTCKRTLLINANKAAKDISRDIIEKMKNPSTKMKVTIQVQSG